jgi:hypothetical protein
MVFYASLFLGLVAGMAVGLFFDGSDAATSAGRSFGITISAAGLSFLAGYAADSFLSMMDLLKARLFSEVRNGGTSSDK